MPASVHRPKVARCVQHVVDGGKDKGSAIPICQASIGESYRIGKAERAVAKKGGKPLKQLRKQQAQTKAAKIQARREKMGWNVAGLIETLNGFCPTGQGGGKDNSCSIGGGKTQVSRKGISAGPVRAKPIKMNITTAAKKLAGKGYEMTGVEPYDLKNKTARYRVKTSKGETVVMTSDQIAQLVKNGFCPTGSGGGRDNSCHGAGGKLNSKADQQRRKLRRIFERAKTSVGLKVNELVAILNGDDDVQTSLTKVSAGAVGGTTALLEHCKKSAKRRKRK